MRRIFPQTDFLFGHLLSQCGEAWAPQGWENSKRAGGGLYLPRLGSPDPEALQPHQSAQTQPPNPWMSQSTASPPHLYWPRSQACACCGPRGPRAVGRGGPAGVCPGSPVAGLCSQSRVGSESRSRGSKTRGPAPHRERLSDWQRACRCCLRGTTPSAGERAIGDTFMARPSLASGRLAPSSAPATPALPARSLSAGPTRTREEHGGSPRHRAEASGAAGPPPGGGRCVPRRHGPPSDPPAPPGPAGGGRATRRRTGGPGQPGAARGLAGPVAVFFGNGGGWSCLGRRSSPGTWRFPRSLPPRAPLAPLFPPSGTHSVRPD